MLNIGDQAPVDVTVTDKEGKTVSLADYTGKYIVLYFYPKDDTPGCTVEACNFRDANKELTKKGAVVIGVSKDAGKSHQKFATKFELPFPLWSDPDHILMEAFGVWGERTFMGKTYMGASRSTFLIDKEGNIVHVWEKVTPKDHANEVLEVLQSLEP